MGLTSLALHRGGSPLLDTGSECLAAARRMAPTWRQASSLEVARRTRPSAHPKQAMRKATGGLPGQHSMHVPMPPSAHWHPLFLAPLRCNCLPLPHTPHPTPPPQAELADVVLLVLANKQDLPQARGGGFLF